MHFGEHQGCNQIIQKGYMRTEFIGMEKARKLLCIMGRVRKQSPWQLWPHRLC